MQFANYKISAQRLELTIIDKEGIAESVIQRFEICYDCLWKILKRYLREELGLADVPNSPKPLFKLAGQNEILKTIAPWLKYADARISTVHDYSRTKAENCLLLVPEIIQDVKSLYQTMTKTWI